MFYVVQKQMGCRNALRMTVLPCTQNTSKRRSQCGYIQGVGTPFEAINSESMAYCHWLGKSVQEVKKNGERYPSRSLHGLVTGLIISRKSLG